MYGFSPHLVLPIPNQKGKRYTGMTANALCMVVNGSIICSIAVEKVKGSRLVKFFYFLDVYSLAFPFFPAYFLPHEFHIARLLYIPHEETGRKNTCRESECLCKCTAYVNGLRFTHLLFVVPYFLCVHYSSLHY